MAVLGTELSRRVGGKPFTTTFSENVTWMETTFPTVKVPSCVLRMLRTVGLAPSTRMPAVLPAAYARLASLPAMSRTVAVPRMREPSEMLTGPISVSRTVYWKTIVFEGDDAGATKVPVRTSVPIVIGSEGLPVTITFSFIVNVNVSTEPSL